MSKKIGIFGIGTVGTQVIYQLSTKKNTNNTQNLEIVGLFSRTKKDLQFQWFDDWKVLVDISDIIVETIGGINIAKDIVLYALESGKIVVTANKYLLATYGAELLPKYSNQLKFEASVCAALPIVKLLKHYYKHDEITEISGILNGTTNYILTQMNHGIVFDVALKNAQDFGFAEADPSFDINGIDSAHKAIILHYLAFKVWISINDIQIQKPKHAKPGEKNITSITNGQISIKNRVDNRFITVNNNSNAINISCRHSGSTFISGVGAGGTETAFAIISGII